MLHLLWKHSDSEDVMETFWFRSWLNQNVSITLLFGASLQWELKKKEIFLAGLLLTHPPIFSHNFHAFRWKRRVTGQRVSFPKPSSCFFIATFRFNKPTSGLWQCQDGVRRHKLSTSVMRPSGMSTNIWRACVGSNTQWKCVRVCVRLARL